jgi:hypothetical protein
MIKQAPAGTPDIMGILNGGRAFGIEVKVKTKLTPQQQAWGDRALKTGAQWGVARSVMDALELIEGWS